MFVDHLVKPKKKNSKIKKTIDSRYIYKIELDKACFSRNMAYRDFKDWSKRTASDKVLKDKIPKYDGCQIGLTAMVYKFFGKKIWY